MKNKKNSLNRFIYLLFWVGIFNIYMQLIKSKDIISNEYLYLV